MRINLRVALDLIIYSHMCGQQRYTKFNKYGFNAVINVTKPPTLLFFSGGVHSIVES